MAEPIQTVEEITPQNADQEAEMAARVAEAFEARGAVDNTAAEADTQPDNIPATTEEEVTGDEEELDETALDAETEDEEAEEDIAPETATIDIDGQEVPVENVKNALQTSQWMQSLPPEAVQGIDAYLSGNYILVPREQYEQLTQQSQQPSQQPSAQDNTAQEDLEELLDPKAAEYLRRQQQELADMRAQLASQEQYLARQTNEQYTTQVVSALQDFASTHELSEAEANQLAQHVGALGTLPQYINAAGGNTIEGTKAALETAYWSIPQYRDRELQSQIQQRIDAELSNNQELSTRKKKASALNGRTASISRIAPKASTPEDNKAQMVEEIAASLSTGQSV